MITQSLLYLLIILILVLTLVIFKQLKKVNNLRKKNLDLKKSINSTEIKSKVLSEESRELKSFFDNYKNYLFIKLDKSAIETGRLYYLSFDSENSIEKFFIKKHRKIENKKKVVNLDLNHKLRIINEVEIEKTQFNKDYDNIVKETNKIK